MELTNKDKINKFSNGIVKATKVVRILAIIGMVGCAIALIFIGIAAIQYDWLLEYVKANPDTMGAIQVKLTESTNVTALIVDKMTLLEMIQNKELTMAVFLDSINDIIGGLVSCAITVILLNIISKIFAKIEKSESPFNTDLNKDLKQSFAAIVILVLVNGGMLVAAIVALTLVVVYYLYQYGASLQNDVDQTI